MAPTIHVVPKAVPMHCPRCECLILEAWEPGQPLCAECTLEAELFDPDARPHAETLTVHLVTRGV